MNYDDWKSTEPDYMTDDAWDRQFDAWEDPMTLDSEYPQDDWFRHEFDDFESLEWKERVVNDLQNTIDEFLKFSTARELIKLVAESL